MIIHCPYCGHHLPHPLTNGMSSCTNCCRAFDSSKQNLLLSTAWLVRKRDIDDSNYLVEKFDIAPEDAELVIKFVADECYSHEEFYAYLKQEFNSCNKRKAS